MKDNAESNTVESVDVKKSNDNSENTPSPNRTENRIDIELPKLVSDKTYREHQGGKDFFKTAVRTLKYFLK